MVRNTPWVLTSESLSHLDYSALYSEHVYMLLHYSALYSVYCIALKCPIYIALEYSVLHYTTVYCTAPPFTALTYNILHYPVSHYTSLCCIGLHQTLALACLSMQWLVTLLSQDLPLSRAYPRDGTSSEKRSYLGGNSSWSEKKTLHIWGNTTNCHLANTHNGNT